MLALPAYDCPNWGTCRIVVMHRMCNGASMTEMHSNQCYWAWRAEHAGPPMQSCLIEQAELVLRVVAETCAG